VGEPSAAAEGEREIEMECDVLQCSAAILAKDAMAVGGFIAAQRDRHGVPYEVSCRALEVSQLCALGSFEHRIEVP
jgi:hypothetical protein